uniref:Uncharacterized protein n=1 Tax=Lygus hesperus TaxID=30085 RepID=A0A0A9XS41_LYGHE
MYTGVEYFVPRRMETPSDIRDELPVWLLNEYYVHVFSVLVNTFATESMESVPFAEATTHTQSLCATVQSTLHFLVFAYIDMLFGEELHISTFSTLSPLNLLLYCRNLRPPPTTPHSD